jgi:hypothetical protein
MVFINQVNQLRHSSLVRCNRVCVSVVSPTAAVRAVVGARDLLLDSTLRGRLGHMCN